jgi:hypothetical protein
VFWKRRLKRRRYGIGHTAHELEPKHQAHPASAPGDFYVEDGMCLACGVPHLVAPSLIGWVEGPDSHCFWKKQPESVAELEQALAVFGAQDAGCHRYAGHDEAILRRVPSAFCDHPLRENH